VYGQELQTKQSIIYRDDAILESNHMDKYNMY